MDKRKKLHANQTNEGKGLVCYVGDCVELINNGLNPFRCHHDEANYFIAFHIKQDFRWQFPGNAIDTDVFIILIGLWGSSTWISIIVDYWSGNNRMYIDVSKSSKWT